MCCHIEKKKIQLEICHVTCQKTQNKKQKVVHFHLQDLKNQALHSFAIDRKMLKQTITLKEKTLKPTVSCQHSINKHSLKLFQPINKNSKQRDPR